ncbi:MAG: aldo/keto reductase [Cyclobacteriaceae bacterium]
MTEQFELAPGFKISRIIKGGWQLSDGHSQVNKDNAVNDMFAFADAGITTFDCADIYTGVEEMIGQFIAEKKQRLGDASNIKILTKFVPDYADLGNLNKSYVERIIDRSLKRLNQERLDMVQFAWWTYDTQGWVEAALWLKELQQAGKVNLISSTNFNTETTNQILEAGVEMSSVQIQYSILDSRPEKSLIDLCKSSNTYVLCYGTVAGGFLSEKWLVKPEPKGEFENRSLTKYKLIIDDIGGWDLFQELLRVLKQIADNHGVGIANIATRFMLDKPQVAGVIVGARNASHLDSNLKTFDFQLSDFDYQKIEEVTSQFQELPDDVFDLERDKEGKHGRIMKYNLNDT